MIKFDWEVNCQAISDVRVILIMLVPPYKNQDEDINIFLNSILCSAKPPTLHGYKSVKSPQHTGLFVSYP